MWHNAVRDLHKFSSPVITGLDAQAYPFSMRCQPHIDEVNQVFAIQLPAGVPISPGPAGLLYHHHDEALWDLKSIQILGRLERVGQGWIFRPEQFFPAMNFLGSVDQMRQIFKARKDAARYQAKHKIARPTVQWKEFLVLVNEAKKSWKQKGRGDHA